MCGIGGILRFDDEAVDRDRLTRMLSPLVCRGPDGRGVHVDGPCGLVHTRLAVLDAPGGSQPMSLGTPDGTLTVVFNGEVYNHRELRRELEAGGHRFTSDHSDTEVLLHGYRAWGDDLPTKLEGMFAFAVWDAAGERLLLARDRTGKKPLFLHQADRKLTFASTLAALLSPYRSLPPIDMAAVGEYLTFGYTRHRTLLTNVEELPPGHVAVVEPTSVMTVSPYWTPPSETPDGSIDFATLLTEAVQRRLEADVPLGCFLSGGIDSSIVAAIAHEQMQRAGQRLKTFSVSMPDARYDEAPWASRVADHLGTDHHELKSEANVESDLRMLTATMGEPLADSSILPTYWVSKAARDHVTVALSGDGGDELFGGYDRYRAMRMLSRYGRWVAATPMVLLSGAGDQKSARARARRLVAAARQPDARRRYQSMIEIFRHDQLRDLGIGRHASIDDWPGCDDAVDAARLWDFAAYLPGDLLRKVDRASMAVALEVRCPLLDTSVVEAALRTPSRVLMPGGRPKGLLRDLSRKRLPADVAARRKMGFAVPIGQWFREELRGVLVSQLLDDGSLADLGCDRDALEALVVDHREHRADHTHRLFALLSLSIWLDWLNGLRAAA